MLVFKLLHSSSLLNFICGLIVLSICRHSKQKVIYEGQQRITGLNFKTHNKSQVLFVATEGEIICITLLPKDKEQKVHSLSWMKLNSFNSDIK